MQQVCVREREKEEGRWGWRRLGDDVMWHAESWRKLKVFSVAVVTVVVCVFVCVRAHNSTVDIVAVTSQRHN